MSESNLDKNLRGAASRESLSYVLKYAIDKGYIVSIIKDYKCGRPGYKDQNQFKAPYLIEFSDNTKWILFTTTSIRERVKTQYWEAYNFKELDASITSAYLVYPDSISEKEKSTAVAKNEKIQSKGEYSTLEGIVSQDQLSNLIEAYALKDKSQGQKLDAKGNSFESRVASILKNPINLKKWKNNDKLLEGVHYSIFCLVVECLNLKSETTNSIDATSDKAIIGLLPTGGPVKTDVLVTVTDNNGSTNYYTISCKRSSENSVSVHQYSADVFADVLDKNNDELRELLNLFQEKGNRRDMGEDNINRLTELMKPHSKALAFWALGGVGGAGKPETQWAKHILTYDNNDGSVSMHTLNDYYNLLIESNVKGMFGTLFGWTYQGKRGTNIQLKCKIIK